MRHLALCAALALGSAVPSAAPRHVDTLTSQQVKSLALLGRVWGFVKYHHPKVTGGSVDWDESLRGAIPRTLSASNARAARDTIDRWLSELGEPPACTSCAVAPDDAYMQADLGWLHDKALLGSSLSERLERIYVNRSVATTQRYVQLAPNIKNAQFTNESAYASAVPPRELRALAVMRFWNMLEYWSPYRDLLEPNRLALMEEFLPQAWAASDSVTYRQVMIRLVARAHDAHANVWNATALRPPTGPARLPVAIRWVEQRYVVGANASANGQSSGLQPGDVLLRIGGVSVDSLAHEMVPYYGSSNEASLHREIAHFLARGPEGAVKVDILRKGAPLTIESRRVPAAEIDESVVTQHSIHGDTFRTLNDSVAYLSLAHVKVADVPEYLRRATGSPVLVIDIRNYPSEFVVFALGSHLAPTGPFAMFTASNPVNPGAFTFTPPVRAPSLEPRYAGKVVILVDETTQSQAEYTTMSFRVAPGALVVGSMTAGADGNVSPFVLPGGLSGYITGLGVFYPDKRPTQQVGIIPDLEVKPTIAGIFSGRDEVLEAGVTRALGRPYRLTLPLSP